MDTPIQLEQVRLALQLSREALLITTTPAGFDLPGKLHQLAGRIADLGGLDGVLIVAFDEEGYPLTYGSKNLGLQGSNPNDQLEVLAKVLAKLKDEILSRGGDPSWLEIDQSFFKISDKQVVLALPLQCRDFVWGFVVVLAGSDDHCWLTKVLAASLIDAVEILAIAIQTAVRIEAWARIERVQGLAQKEFERKDRDLGGLVKKLNLLFEADVVTLLLEDQNELHLAASTDPRLGSEKPVIYHPGQGLTGYVFQTQQALRLRSTGDAEEIRRITGLDRKSPTHAEHDGTNWLYGQFLAVPLRYGGRAVGVLRMSRRGSVTRFALSDEKSLQFFADLLAIDLARSWHLLLLRSVLESTSDAIVASKQEPDGHGGTWRRIILANPGTERLFGLQLDKIIDTDARGLYAPGAYDKIRNGLEAAVRAAEGKGFIEYGPVETMIQRADGALKPVEISYRVLANRMVHPPTVYAIGIARDTSERQAEALRRLSEALGIVYFRADREGLTLESTPNESTITGYSREELVSFPRKDLYADPNERDRLLDKLRRQEDGQLMGEILKFRRKDGSVFLIEADLLSVRDPDGKVIRLEGFYKDVSRRIQLQGFLDADTKRVLADEELLSKLRQHAEFHLNYTISLGHQLQTPLSSLVENLRNFEQGLTHPNFVSERLPYIIGQAVVCTRLVRNLSYMDKILRDEPFHFEKVSLGKLAIETKLDFKHLLEEKGLKLALDDASIDRYIEIQGSREMLRQVFVNLVDNAIKYSSHKTTIVIRAQQWPQGAVLEVSNQGLPIPEEVREKIFERGFRTERAQSLIPHGTGLGLWLVRKILRAHKASISCHVVTEQGQTRNVFRIIFPHKTPKLSVRRSV